MPLLLASFPGPRLCYCLTQPQRTGGKQFKQAVRMNDRAIAELIAATEWTPEQQVQELERRFGFLISGNEKISFTPCPSDVIVCTAPKSGTTWLLYITHQLRMGRVEPDFEELTDVIAWIDKELANVNPQTMVQPAEPRVFYSHLMSPNIPKGGKMICCYRMQYILRIVSMIRSSH